MKQASSVWGPRYASYWMAAFIAVGIVFIGIRYSVIPLVSAKAFGLPLPADRTVLYGNIKGVRDIFSGLVLGYLLYRRDVRTTAMVFAFATFIPMVDAWVVFSANGSNNLPAFFIHAGTALYGVVTTALLFRDVSKNTLKNNSRPPYDGFENASL